MNDLTTDNKVWLDLLVFELRLLDVSGRDIGDALASAREFLADSGERAEDSFGSPDGYRGGRAQRDSRVDGHAGALTTC